MKFEVLILLLSVVGISGWRYGCCPTMPPVTNNAIKSLLVSRSGHTPQRLSASSFCENSNNDFRVNHAQNHIFQHSKSRSTTSLRMAVVKSDDIEREIEVLKDNMKQLKKKFSDFENDTSPKDEFSRTVYLEDKKLFTILASYLHSRLAAAAAAAHMSAKSISQFQCEIIQRKVTHLSGGEVLESEGENLKIMSIPEVFNLRYGDIPSSIYIRPCYV